MPKTDPLAQSSPTIAIAICTRDRADALLQTLRSIFSLTRKPDEFILIDDGILPAATVDHIRSQFSHHRIPLQFAANERPGLTRARNLAVRMAASEVVQFLDDDVDLAPNFLCEIERLFRDPHVSGVTASIEEPAFKNSKARLFNLGYRLSGWWHVHPRGEPRSPRPAVMECKTLATRAKWMSGAAMAFRRSVLLQHPFDETLSEYALGEDREIGYRLAPSHWILHAKRARVIHRRDAGGRTSPRRFGYMAARNVLYILHKTCKPRWFERIQIVASLAGVALMHAIAAIVGRGENHRQTLKGLLEGATSWYTRAPKLNRPNDVPAVRRYWPTCRVLFVTNRLEPGGAEAMLIALARGLPNLEIRPVIACLKDAGPLATACTDEGIAVYERVLNHKYDAAALIRLKNLIRQEHIDVVVAAHSGGDRMFWTTLAGRICGIPVVAWSHWSPVAGRSHIESVNRWMFRWVKRFVAIGERPRQLLAQYEQVPLARTAVISNGIDVQAVASRATIAARLRIRTELDLSDSDVAVAIIANLRPEKRHDIFIEAARRLLDANNASDSRPTLRFFIIGDGPERERIERGIFESKTPPHAITLLGARSDVPELLAAMDIACLCSDLECLSVVMLEAAGAGCPFIGPNSGAMGEFLVHGETGWMTRPADADGLIHGIATLAADSDLRARLSRRAREIVESRFGQNRMVEQFAEMFRNLQVDASESTHNGDWQGHVSSRARCADEKLGDVAKAT